MKDKFKIVFTTLSSCTGTKVQIFLKYKKLSYICVENFKIIIVYVHKNT